LLHQVGFLFELNENSVAEMLNVFRRGFLDLLEIKSGGLQSE